MEQTSTKFKVFVMGLFVAAALCFGLAIHNNNESALTRHRVRVGVVTLDKREAPKVTVVDEVVIVGKVEPKVRKNTVATDPTKAVPQIDMTGFNGLFTSEQNVKALKHGTLDEEYEKQPSLNMVRPDGKPSGQNVPVTTGNHK